MERRLVCTVTNYVLVSEQDGWVDMIGYCASFLTLRIFTITD